MPHTRFNQTKMEKTSSLRIGELDPMALRNDFPLFDSDNQPDLIYLDSAATSQTPRLVIEAMNTYYQSYRSNIHRGMYAISEKATREYEHARSRVASFIQAHPDEIIFTRGTTESLNALAYSLTKKLTANDEVIITELEHHSNLVPWQQLAKERGFRLRFIPITGTYELDLDAYRSMLSERTKIVSIAWVSNTLGLCVPVKEIGELAHSVGALVVVDGAQGVPHLTTNVDFMDCDFFAFSGHKMFGPTGIGVLYGKREHLERMDPFLYGGGMIKDVCLDDSEWADIPAKFEAGTPPIAEAIGLGAAISYIQHIGMSAITHHTKELATYAYDQLSKYKEIRCITPADPAQRSSVITFHHQVIHAHDLTSILNREKIAVRAGHHCAMPLMKKLGIPSSVRASFSVFNTKDEIDQLIQGINKTHKIFKVKR